MAGVPGQSSKGQPRKSLAQLVASGTFRTSRHAHLLREVAVPSAPVPPVPAALVEGLGVRGVAVVTALWAQHDFEGHAAAQVLLRNLGMAVDASEDPTLSRRERVQAMRLSLDTLRHLNLEK